MRNTGITAPVVTLLYGPLTIAAQKDFPPIDADCPEGFVRQIKYAETFEICEYGRRPSKKEVRKLFPFLASP